MGFRIYDRVARFISFFCLAKLLFSQPNDRAGDVRYKEPGQRYEPNHIEARQ